MDKTRIRALILDYGGVISKPQNPKNVNTMLQILKQDRNGFETVYQDNRDNYDSGQLSGTDYWIRVVRHYGLSQPSDSDITRLIQEDVNSWTHINQRMLRFIEESRDRLYKLAIISNMTRDTLAFMKIHFQWLELFDELIFSCEVGVNKPDPRIYEDCLHRLEIAPQECLFVDDSAANVTGARQAGMHAIRFRSFPEFRQELDQDFRLDR